MKLTISGIYSVRVWTIIEGEICMLNYKMSINQEKVNGVIEYIASYDTLKVSGTGSTIGEAIEQLDSNAKSRILFMKAEKKKIPAEDGGIEETEEEKKTYSGKMTLRLSKSTHRRIAELADKDGVSLNQLINNAVCEYLGKMTRKQR